MAIEELGGPSLNVCLDILDYLESYDYLHAYSKVVEKRPVKASSLPCSCCRQYTISVI